MSSYVRKLSDGQIRQAKGLRLIGWSMREIGERYGVSGQAIRYHLLRTKPAESNPDRDDAGVIVTVREQKSGALRSLHEPGLRGPALYEVCKRIDRLPGDWKVVGYSTPSTVRSDLHGSRDTNSLSKQGSSNGNNSVERTALAKVRRLDLLDPRLEK